MTEKQGEHRDQTDYAREILERVLVIDDAEVEARAQWPYNSLIAGGLKESRSAAGFGGPKLGFRDGGANSTLIDGGAICDACPISLVLLLLPVFIMTSGSIPYISVGADGN